HDLVHAHRQVGEAICAGIVAESGAHEACACAGGCDAGPGHDGAVLIADGARDVPARLLGEGGRGRSKPQRSRQDQPDGSASHRPPLSSERVVQASSIAFYPRGGTSVKGNDSTAWRSNCWTRPTLGRTGEDGEGDRPRVHRDADFALAEEQALERERREDL